MARARKAKPAGKAKKSASSNQKVGRPSEFKPDYCEQVVKLCRLGATDQDIAEFFNVSTTTIDNWKIRYPEFLGAVRAGKIEADVQVANSLFKKATGYVVEVEKVVGRADDRKIVKMNIAIEPDTQACMFWLKNRRKDQWRDKQEIDVTVMNHEQALEALEQEANADVTRVH